MKIKQDSYLQSKAKQLQPLSLTLQQKLALRQKVEKSTAYKVEEKLQTIFKQFSFGSITFSLFVVNCIMWLSVHIVYYWGPISNWDCVQYIFYAKFQPSITYNHQIWRLLLSCFMFRGWIQFYFNNFALNMLGYVIEKQSKPKFVFTYFGGILAGHMLSCCWASPSRLTVGTSCGTIALLPIQLKRFAILRKTNPLQAKSRLKFIIFNLISNFALNVLAIFKLDTVDWISHIGCLIAGLLFLIIFWMIKIQRNPQKRKNINPIVIKIIKYSAICILIAFYTLMAVVIWKYLPSKRIGLAQLDEINFLCNTVK